MYFLALLTFSEYYDQRQKLIAMQKLLDLAGSGCLSSLSVQATALKKKTFATHNFFHILKMRFNISREK